ncbi:MAG TPA: hypothetical protein VGI17_03645 [Solirubrobacterales bacterium]
MPLLDRDLRLLDDLAAGLADLEPAGRAGLDCFVDFDFVDFDRRDVLARAEVGRFFV